MNTNLFLHRSVRLLSGIAQSVFRLRNPNTRVHHTRAMHERARLGTAYGVAVKTRNGRWESKGYPNSHSREDSYLASFKLMF